MAKKAVAPPSVSSKDSDWLCCIQTGRNCFTLLLFETYPPVFRSVTGQSAVYVNISTDDYEYDFFVVELKYIRFLFMHCLLLYKLWT